MLRLKNNIYIIDQDATPSRISHASLSTGFHPLLACTRNLRRVGDNPPPTALSTSNPESRPWSWVFDFLTFFLLLSL